MSVFADRRRGGRLSNLSMLINVVESVIALLVILTNDDVNKVKVKRLR